MCGIFAVIGKFSKKQSDNYAEIAHVSQGHRGPDMKFHEHVELGDSWSMLLGHQRLSILDLSESGRQPMHSLVTNNIISFNGEIYNFLELAEEISFKPRTGTDTEVLLEVIDRNGVESGCKRLNGMWSFIYLNRASNEIFISRDRAGEKPLYFYKEDDLMVIASELKTVAALSGKKFDVDLQVAGEYLVQSLQDTGERTWLKGIHSFSAGCVGKLSLGKKIDLVKAPYWDFDPVQSSRSFNDAVTETKELVLDSVNIRLRADVPVGITLSGGVDSTIIASSMVKLLGSGERINAISAVSPGQDGDESQYIDLVCKELGIKSHKVDLAWSPDESVRLMEKVTWFNDAPIGSFSNIAFFRLMEKSKELGIKVVLSGQGADEIYCGYRKYYYWAVIEMMKSGHPIGAAQEIVMSFIRGTVLGQFSFAEASRYLPSRMKKRSMSILGEATQTEFRSLQVGLNGGDVRSRQISDVKSFSVPYLTHYEDRNSMAHGVEVRLPFLDPRLLSSAISYPVNFKISNGWTKFVLRKAFEGLAPQEVLWRKDKLGFSNPQEQWMKTFLAPIMDDVYRSDLRIYKLGIIDKNKLLDKWNGFKAGNKDIWYREVFAPWALEVWLEKYSEYIN